MAREAHAAMRAGSAAQRERANQSHSASSDYDAGEKLLLAAAVVVARARRAVTEQLGFTCSGGVFGGVLFRRA